MQQLFNPILILLLMIGTAFAADFNDRAPNAPDQRPAFKGQTRAPILDDNGVDLTRRIIANNLVNPWGMDQLPDGRWLVTERPGRLRIITPNGMISKPIKGLPDVDARGQGGLLDVIIGDNFTASRRIWWSYAEPRKGRLNGTSVATGILSADEATLTDVRVIFRQTPGWKSTYHFGSRLVFDQTGALFVTTGERSYPEPRELAQDITTHIGKILRINPMGGAAPGNPNLDGGKPEIWSYGHRNLQAATLSPDGQLWTVEHGPRGGDELNQPVQGRNYGWPVITYGEDYGGGPIGQGLTAKAGMEQPIYYWDPVIAPSGMAFYSGALFPEWQGSLLIGGLASKSLIRLELKDGKVMGEARYMQGRGRVRDVDITPSGAIMILTDSNNGALIELTPQK